MGANEMTGATVDGSGLMRGQDVRVRVGAEDLGKGKVDDLSDDGSIVWVRFSGASTRRMFIPEDQAQFTVLPPASLR